MYKKYKEHAVCHERRYRQDAIKEGRLIDITANYPELTGMFIFPVCFTVGVWKLVNQAQCDGNLNIRTVMVEAVLRAMTRNDVHKKGNMLFFTARLIDGNDQLQHYFLESMIDTGDDGEPVITVGLQGEGYVY